jgi:hypothetical protein
MSAHCRKITFEMEEDGQVWETVFTMENVNDASIKQSFLPDTAEEEILIRIVRRTRQTEEYASYVNSLQRYRF